MKDKMKAMARAVQLVHNCHSTRWPCAPAVVKAQDRLERRGMISNMMAERVRRRMRPRVPLDGLGARWEKRLAAGACGPHCIVGVLSKCM